MDQTELVPNQFSALAAFKIDYTLLSDGPRDGGEAGIGRLAPDKAIGDDRDGVSLALVFAHEHSAGLEAPRAIGS
jgi:hypothetical protein